MPWYCDRRATMKRGKSAAESADLIYEPGHLK